MKVNILDAHDRLQSFHKQADMISQGCQDCIKNRPKEFGNHPFYIFAHKREIGMDERVAIYNDDLYASIADPAYAREYPDLSYVPTTRLIWSPRLSKPKSQTNSMLFKAYPPGDNIKVIWMIPDREMWEQYNHGKLAENKTVCESIYDFQYNRQKLEELEDDDLSDEVINAIYKEIARNQKQPKFKMI